MRRSAYGFCQGLRGAVIDLLGGPGGGWIRGDVEVQHASAIMSQYDEAIQQAERGSRDDKEVDRSDVADVIGQKRAPD
jgi:hypothetical protein